MAIILIAFALVTARDVNAFATFASVPVVSLRTTGAAVPGVDAPDRIVLANEPGSVVGAMGEWDLETVTQHETPLARLPIELERLHVARPGLQATGERGVIHVSWLAADGSERLVGSSHLKPGGKSNLYMLDVTEAVNRVLRQPAGQRRLRLAVRLEGKPIPFEVYALSTADLTLKIASDVDWVDTCEQSVAPVVQGPVVFRESCLAITEERGVEVALRTLYPVERVREVVALGTGQPLLAGRDWVLRDGRIVLPVGTTAPVQLAGEFFLTTRKDKDGVERTTREAIKLVQGAWYHERQIAVTYEPEARDWSWPAAIGSLEQLPRTKARLEAGQPLRLVVFGDSISEGFDGSKKSGVWPYGACYGELVARALEARYGCAVTYMNHARAGGTAAHAVTQADAQVAWFHPDLVLLAYGMNDRSEERRVAEKANLEKIIDVVRARSPETEFIVISPMLNNPRLPMGLGPIQFVRDQVLAVARPGITFVDLTSTHLAMLERKDYLDLSGNGANHPNDFMHRIYAQRILEVLAPDAHRSQRSVASDALITNADNTMPSAFGAVGTSEPGHVAAKVRFSLPGVRP